MRAASTHNALCTVASEGIPGYPVRPIATPNDLAMWSVSSTSIWRRLTGLLWPQRFLRTTAPRLPASYQVERHPGLTERVMSEAGVRGLWACEPSAGVLGPSSTLPRLPCHKYGQRSEGQVQNLRNGQVLVRLSSMKFLEELSSCATVRPWVILLLRAAWSERTWTKNPDGPLPSGPNAIKGIELSRELEMATE